MMVSVRSELSFSYDEHARPLSAKCAQCGEKMPSPGPELKSSADVIMWFAARFLEHKRLTHPGSSRVVLDPDQL